MKKDIIFSANQVNGRVRGRKNFILTDVSFVLPGGYIMGLIGKNGAVEIENVALSLLIVLRAVD